MMDDFYKEILEDLNTLIAKLHDNEAWVYLNDVGKIKQKIELKLEETK